MTISTFIVRGIFESVPKEIVNSARVDGAGSFRVRREPVPLVKNGIVVVVIDILWRAGAGFVLALTLMNDAEHRK